MDEENRRNVLIRQAEKTKKLAYLSILLGSFSLIAAVLAVPMLFLRAQYLLSTVQEEGFFCHSRSQVIFHELERNGASASNGAINPSASWTRRIRSSGSGSYALAYTPERRGGSANTATRGGGGLPGVLPRGVLGGATTITTAGSSCNVCTCGKGPAGPVGPPGDDGQPGVDGQPGLNGQHGPPSPEPSPPNIDWCQDCPKAPAGPPGSPGLKGEHGLNGRHGTVGRNGNPGPPGEQGSTGPAGPQGEPGMKGPPGNAGMLVDMPGPPGPVGHPGVPGEVGAPGQPGNQGRPGAKGIPGIPGESGSPGAKGNPGLNGLDGDRGQPGAEGGCDHCSLPRTQPGYL